MSSQCSHWCRGIASSCQWKCIPSLVSLLTLFLFTPKAVFQWRLKDEQNKVGCFKDLLFSLIFLCGIYHGTNFNTLFFKWSLAVFHSWDGFEHSKFTHPTSNTALATLPLHLPRFRAFCLVSCQAQESALNIHNLVISELQAPLLFFSQGYHFALAKSGVLNQSHFFELSKHQKRRRKKKKIWKIKLTAVRFFFHIHLPQTAEWIL